MVLFNCDSENEKNIKVLFKSLSKIKDEIAELKKKTSEIEEYKSYAERMSRENEALKQNDEKGGQIKWTFIISLGVGLSFLFFSGLCVWLLLFSTTCVTVHDSIPMLIVGAIVYFVMTVLLVLFAYQSMHVFKHEEKITKKK